MEIEQQHWDRNDNLSMDPNVWQMDVVAAMRAALEHPDRTRTIGGRIQSITITKDGSREQQVSWVGEGGDPTKEADWTQATVPLADVKASKWSRTAEAPDPEPGIVHAHVLS
jgi:hypothetical protein